jgi:hypothetical protein
MKNLTILILILMALGCLSCEYSMKEVWTCANGGERHHRGCLTASDIHRAVRTKTSLFSKPVILHSEGPRFHKLFRDCDTDGDGCIHPAEAEKAPKCKRDCGWKEIWIKTFC